MKYQRLWNENQELSAIAAAVISKAKTSELFDSTVHHRVFVADKPVLYGLLNGS